MSGHGFSLFSAKRFDFATIADAYKHLGDVSWYPRDAPANVIVAREELVIAGDWGWLQIVDRDGELPQTMKELLETQPEHMPRIWALGDELHHLSIISRGGSVADELALKHFPTHGLVLVNNEEGDSSTLMEIQHRIAVGEEWQPRRYEREAFIIARQPFSLIELARAYQRFGEAFWQPLFEDPNGDPFQYTLLITARPTFDLTGNWGYFSASVEDWLYGSAADDKERLPLEGFAKVEAFGRPRNVLHIQYHQPEAAAVALLNLPVPDDSLVCDDHGQVLSLAEVRQRLAAGEEWQPPLTEKEMRSRRTGIPVDEL